MKATHVVFQAKLMKEKRDFGVHSFFARIRDQTTGELFKGIELGKSQGSFSVAHQQTGYMKFTDFKLPKDALLSRFIRISNRGEMEMIGNPKNANATMNEIR